MVAVLTFGIPVMSQGTDDLCEEGFIKISKPTEDIFRPLITCIDPKKLEELRKEGWEAVSPNLNILDTIVKPVEGIILIKGVFGEVKSYLFTLESREIVICIVVQSK